MRVAVFQCDLAGADAEARLARLYQVMQQAQADLLLCPELFMSGYHVGDRIRQLAEGQDGPFARRVSEIARTTGTAVAYGYPEAAGGRIYNSALCIGRDGEALANHRKLVIPPGPEVGHFTAGEGLTLFDLHGIRIALLICYDIEFPEAARAASAAGAEVILAPTALAAQWAVVAERVIPARAFENGTHIVYANHAGTENGLNYAGSSVILDPVGGDQARAGATEAVIMADMDPDQVRSARTRLPYLRDVAALRDRLV
ncbi:MULTISPECIES: carbon-nitrogen hydrolase family protein [unclassified Minwuia]|jgi:predicted amidohydrolase|uniref:carbon-nitrogen hydrolase family protein n=1 Tax=unclassified Minwuia TaxID=2618799 RepID=UPI002479C743|nr:MULTISPECIES: carbon-nitrogen hydrolase family protein [unclassified Minwuia]